MKCSFLMPALFLIIATHCVFSQTSGREYIGFRYKGVVPNSVLANGVKHLGGSVLGDVFADPVYGISIVSKGKTKMLWLEVSTGQNSGGVTGWRVLDVLSFFNQRANDHLLFGSDPSIECRRNGKPVDNLVGIGRIVRRQALFRPSILWIANVSSKKFVPISAAGIRCVYSEP
jgi:hypothetical protein